MSTDKKDTDVKVPIVDPPAEKEDPPEEEPTEKSPLKPENGSLPGSGDVKKSSEKLADPEKDPEKDEDGSESEDEDRLDRLRQLLQDPKPQFILVTGLVIAFAVLTIIVVVIAVARSDDDWDDKTPRMLRIIPTPNGPGNLIRFRGDLHGNGTWSGLSNQITELFTAYAIENNRDKNYTTCDSRPSPSPEITCFFSSELIKIRCNEKDHYGYPDGRPCVIIQINHERLREWTPEVYTADDLRDQPGLPEGLRQSYRYTGLYIECRGNTIVDQENAGQITVVPGNEISKNLFPYNGHPHYMAPFLAVQFDKPVQNVVVGITCRLWARNVGARIEVDPLTNQTRTIWPPKPLPDAELPFNILVE